MRPDPLNSLAELDPERLKRALAALVIEDSDHWADEIAALIGGIGDWTVSRACDRASALAMLGARRFDLLVVDRNLEPDDGLELLGDLRRRGLRTPAILLTTMGDVGDVVQGLREGGDDYVVKPPRPAELEARIAALMRRVDEDGRLVFGALEVNFRYNHVLFHGRPVTMNQRERSLLGYLALRDPEPVSMAQLLEKLWRYRPVRWVDGVERMHNPGGVVDVSFSLLRARLAQAGVDKALIRAHPASMPSEDFAALKLDKAQAVMARDLTKSWSLDAAALQAPPS